MPEEFRAFQLDMNERCVGAPTFNNRLAVLSFFYATTCPRPEMKRHFRNQRAAKKTSVGLSAEQVARILEAAPCLGLQYRAAFSVAYGGGLEASEVTHLKVGDIVSDRMKTMRLTTDAFIRRFLIHVLPSGFHRIRHTGVLANGIRRDRIAKIAGC